MDMAFIIAHLVQAIGGLIGGNLVGAAMRGGGGPTGRAIVGAVGGLAAGFGLPLIAPDLSAALSGLIAGEAGLQLGNLIVGAGGGAILGAISGLVVRTRAES